MENQDEVNRRSLRDSTGFAQERCYVDEFRFNYLDSYAESGINYFNVFIYEPIEGL